MTFSIKIIEELQILPKNCKGFLNFSKISKTLQLSDSGVRRGLQCSTPPPEPEKNCCRKMMLFPKALFLETTFPKNR